MIRRVKNQSSNRVREDKRVLSADVEVEIEVDLRGNPQNG